VEGPKSKRVRSKNSGRDRIGDRLFLLCLLFGIFGRAGGGRRGHLSFNVS